MNGNAIAFINTFLSYLLLYILFGACVVGAVFAGIAVRKRKDAKDKVSEDAKPKEEAAA